MAFKLKLTKSPLPPALTPFLAGLGVIRGSTTSRDEENWAPMFFTKQPLSFKSISFPTLRSNICWLIVGVKQMLPSPTPNKNSLKCHPKRSKPNIASHTPCPLPCPFAVIDPKSANQCLSVRQKEAPALICSGATCWKGTIKPSGIIWTLVFLELLPCLPASNNLENQKGVYYIL